MYGYNKYSKNDSIEFTVLDDINGVLDTAIYLFNQGNATKASHYLEVALFGNNHKKDVLALKKTTEKDILKEKSTEMWTRKSK